jgi:apolipoprotein N-acyltransferase
MTRTAPPAGRGRPAVTDEPRDTALPLALVAAVVGGLLWAATQPPVGWSLPALLVVGAWLLAVDLVADRGPGAAAAIGSVLGSVAFLLILPWLAAPAGWAAVVLLSGVQAAWLGLASVAVRRWTRSPWIVLVAPVLFTAMEIARARFPLGGFGWADLASGHAGGSYLLGTARVIGADGLTLLSALAGALVFDLVRRARRHAADPDVSRGVEGGIAAVDAVRPALLGLVGVGVAGLLVTIGAPGGEGSVEVLLAQGNDGTNAEVGAAEDLRIATALADTTLAAIAADGVPQMIVWPEYALDGDPFTPQRAELAEQVARVHDQARVPLVAGVRRSTGVPGTFANEMVVIGPDGMPDDAYRKQRIVPFGEYVPLRRVFGGLPPLARFVPNDALPGEGPAVLRVAGIDVAVAICFETLFSSVVQEGVREADAGFVLAATNDASYGVSQASAQHVGQSVLRAVETGRTVVHASLNGISAVIDPDGVVQQRAELFEVTTLRAQIPLATGSTPALVVAPVLALVVLLGGAGITAHALWPRRTRDAS